MRPAAMEYDDFFTCLDHMPCQDPWAEGGVVDFNTLFNAVKLLNSKANRIEFEEAILQHFAHTANRPGAVKIEKQKVCSHVEMGTGCRHKFVAACRSSGCNNPKRTNAKLVFNVKYVPTY